MKIVIVGNYNEKKAGANFYATVRKLANGFTRNGHAVLSYSDRDIARSASAWGFGRAGVRKANRQLVDVCRDFRPDLIVSMHADQIANDTLREIRGLLPGLRIAAVNLDPIFLPENPPRIRRLADVADITFITTAGETLAQFATPSHRVAFIPNPADRSIETLECFAHENQSFDLLCTIGSEKGTPWRANAMRALKAAVPEARYGFFGIDGQGPVFGAAYFDAIANASMGLNLNRSDDDYLYSSDRLAQFAGNGLLVFVERTSGYGDLFGEDEFAFYEGPGELAEKLRHFLAHDGERQTVAQKGHAKYHALFNERIVARFIAEATFGTHKAADYAWPTNVYGG
ncbi:MAG: glycosyltransferase [Parvibaculum sp.]|uniref:glycosyltransferase family protein n=1 Tax=Parvibaculum sp. TaxID=2024848 RepID=UPI0025D1754C|nr:glycosyltransferase [Parvibaculum sp.]MCE9648808.1 glycosyltransferase [Parvibaculum sp.]